MTPPWQLNFYCRTIPPPGVFQPTSDYPATRCLPLHSHVAKGARREACATLLKKRGKVIVVPPPLVSQIWSDIGPMSKVGRARHNLGRSRLKCGRFWACFVQDRSKPVDMGPTFQARNAPKSAQGKGGRHSGPNSAGAWPKLVELCRSRSNPCRKPQAADIGANLADPKQKLVDIGRVRPQIGRSRPDCRLRVECLPISARTRRYT